MANLLMSLAILSVANPTSLKIFEYTRRMCLRKPILESFFNFLVEKTLFTQFCAGSSELQVQQTTKRLLQMKNIHSILDYAAEKEYFISKGEFMKFSLQNHLHITNSIRIAADCGAAVALKVSSLVPHWILAAETHEDLLTGIGKEAWMMLEDVVKRASDAKVNLFFDAEQSSIQSTIDEIALYFMQKYPKGIYNTYQMYLKDSKSKLMKHYELLAGKGLPFHAKIVRGAYLLEEPKEILCSSPEETHANYDEGVAFMLQSMQKDAISRCMLATHNKTSIEKALEASWKLGVQERVSYAQLLGMCDFLTERLAKKKGVSVYKYVPYGPVSEVMPYLVRRAIENSSILAANKAEEKKYLWSQIGNAFKARIFRQ